MAYLLDTCAISEMVAATPNQNVLDWFEHQPESTLYLSIISWGEIQKGIYQLPKGKRMVQLETWLNDELAPTFEGRIIDIDDGVITCWAKMLAGFKSRGIVRPSMDSLIEATALKRDLILVTRNEKNFQDSDVSILNPWNS